MPHFIGLASCRDGRVLPLCLVLRTIPADASLHRYFKGVVTRRLGWVASRLGERKSRMKGYRRFKRMRKGPNSSDTSLAQPRFQQQDQLARISVHDGNTRLQGCRNIEGLSTIGRRILPRHCQSRIVSAPSIHRNLSTSAPGVSKLHRGLYHLQNVLGESCPSELQTKRLTASKQRKDVLSAAIGDRQRLCRELLLGLQSCQLA